MAEYEVVELTAEETYPLRLAVLRNDTPSKDPAFAEDDLAGTVHLGVRHGDEVVAISTWIPRAYDGEHAVQVRGMAVAAHLRSTGVGGLLVEAGCARAAPVVPLVWGRARDTALHFYTNHGFTVVGEGFVDESTGKPHHIIVRHLP